MDYNRIAVRYAKALLKAAQETDLTDKIYTDLKKIADTTDKEDFKTVMNNPVYPNDAKKNIIRELFAQQAEELSLRLLYLLIDKNREALIPAVIRNYGQLYRKEKNLSRVELTTAHKTDGEFNNEVKNLIEKKFDTSAEILYTQNKKIIGGFIINIEDKQLDASIQSKLNTIKKQLTD